MQSHKKAFMATRMGKFKDEIVPVEVVKKAAGQEVAKETHHPGREHQPRPDRAEGGALPDRLQEGRLGDAGERLPDERRRGGHAGDAPPRRAEKLGLKPMARILGFGFTGVDPAYMGIGPATALPKALKRARA